MYGPTYCSLGQHLADGQKEYKKSAEQAMGKQAQKQHFSMASASVHASRFLHWLNFQWSVTLEL